MVLLVLKEESFKRSPSTYFDDLYINKNVTAVTQVREKLAHFGVVCKDLQQLKEVTSMLRLEVWG